MGAALEHLWKSISHAPCRELRTSPCHFSTSHWITVHFISFLIFSYFKRQFAWRSSLFCYGLSEAPAQVGGTCAGVTKASLGPQRLQHGHPALCSGTSKLVASAELHDLPPSNSLPPLTLSISPGEERHCAIRPHLMKCALISGSI